MKKLFFTFLIGCFIIIYTQAQKAQNSDIPKLKKWSIVTYLSLYAFGGPQKQVEDQMIKYGFYDPMSSYDSPYSSFGPKRTYGPVPEDANLQVTYSTRYIATIFSYNLYDILRIGIGPSVNFTKAWESSHSYERIDVEYYNTKVGFIIDFGFRIPRKTRLFGELNVQYRYVGKVEIGPFYVNPNHDPLPPITIKYDHFSICPGFGVRF